MQRIHVIDSHTAGEPTRVVIGGGPDLGTGTMALRRALFRERHDDFRSAVVNEPRGSDVVVGALLCEPTDASCVAGVVFFNNVGVLNMCGHGTIGVAVTLAHLGRIKPGRHRLETPVGIVAFDYKGGNVVTIENVPSYRHAKAVTVNVDGHGPVSGDVAWGGNWFFLVGDHREELILANVKRLTDLTWRIRQALVRDGVTGAGGGEIDHIELFGPPGDRANHGRNFVLCPGKAYDRSPCGTGTSAKLACLFADGKLREGEAWRQESIIGSVFEGSVKKVGDQVIPSITGSAYVCAEATLLIDPGDPFGKGILRMNASRGIVVGGGVVGAACAYYLAKAGWKVTVLDKGAFGKGCSHGNCGFVSPSHVLPLAGPGVIWQTMKAMLAKNSPFAVKPGLNLALWGWLWRFARRCNEHDMLEAARAIQALLISSRSLYDELTATEPFDCEWQPRGVLFAFRTQAGLDHHAHTANLLRTSFGVTSSFISGDRLREVEPALKPGLAGAFHYPGDAHLRPDKLMTSWRRVLETLGVAIREHAEISDFVREGGRAVKVTVGTEELSADAFVIATGAWTPLLNRQLGCKVPIQPGKGYSITMPRPARCPVLPLLFEEDRVGVTPMHSGYRLGSTMEFAGYDATLNRRRLDLLREGARHYLEEPYAEPIEEEWFGWRPMTPDSVPIIDRSPALDNVWIAAGHNMLGVSMAPATGKLVAELLGGTAPHIDPGPYTLARF